MIYSHSLPRHVHPPPPPRLNIIRGITGDSSGRCGVESQPLVRVLTVMRPRRFLTLSLVSRPCRCADAGEKGCLRSTAPSSLRTVSTSALRSFFSFLYGRYSVLHSGTWFSCMRFPNPTIVTSAMQGSHTHLRDANAAYPFRSAALSSARAPRDSSFPLPPIR